MADKVIVGISGGVDSSVAALLLTQQGFDVEALFMKNWDEEIDDSRCLWEADVEDAMQVCDKLKIPLNTVDLSREYWQSVFTQFLQEYKNGRTPNPDILCNQEVKFKAFLDHALQLGADKIATGHYASVTTDRAKFKLIKARDLNKDQTYFLCRLNQQQLGQTLFPLADLPKPTVRQQAEKAKLVTFNKKDSTGICFIGERPFRDFLSQYIPVSPGEIRTIDGTVIGQHQGIHFYTLGQRQGLGIGGIKGADSAPWYVIDKNLDDNCLIVTQGHDHPLLFSRGLNASNLHWIADTPPDIPLKCKAKIRYRQPDQDCILEFLAANEARISFNEPQRAVTPGQYIVFYEDSVCLGGGIIDATWQ